MVAPAYATDLTDISTNNVFTEADGWDLQTEGGGGQNAITAPELDDFIQGTRGVSRNPFSSSVRGIGYDAGTTVAVATDDAVYYWWKADVAQALDVIANGGVHLTMGTSYTVYKRFYVAGSDTYARGGWRCTPIDPTEAGNADRGSPGAPDYAFFGVMFDIPASGPSKGFPFKCDMIRHGRSVDVTEGDSGDPATWDKLTAHTDNIDRQWGIIQGTDTGAVLQGIANWGTGATAVYSRDSNRAIVFADTLGFVPSDFTQIVFANASTDVEWSNLTFVALDTLNRGLIDIQNNAAVSILGCTFLDIGPTTDGGSNSVFDGSVWIGCEPITAAGGSFVGITVEDSTAATNESAFVYNETADPGTLLEGATFVKGAGSTHAIEFGLSSPTSITLDGVTFEGYNASNNQNDSAIHIKRTSGTVTINLTNGATSPSYRTDGAAVVVQQSVTLTFSPLVSGSAITVARQSNQEVLYDDGNTGTSSPFSYNAATLGGVLVDVVIMQVGSEPFQALGFALPAVSQSFNVSQSDDSVFDNP